MEIVNNIELYDNNEKTAIALGTFDGIHSAHKAVIEKVVSSDFIPAVFTFNQSPAGVINGEAVATLTAKPFKQKLMEQLGIKLYISPDFLSIKDMTPTEFIDMLYNKFGAKEIACGFNFHFGKNGAGNAGVLKQLCKERDIILHILPPFLMDDEPVSSTRIRGLIENGEIEKANELLGYSFTLQFPVIEGNHLGRSFDFPTINQKLPVNFIVPKNGVYASKSEIDGKLYKSISNIGYKPTVGSDYISCETFVFNYDGDLYGKTVPVSLYIFIREERKFEDLNELQTAIKRDTELVEGLEY